MHISTSSDEFDGSIVCSLFDRSLETALTLDFDYILILCIGAEGTRIAREVTVEQWIRCLSVSTASACVPSRHSVPEATPAKANAQMTRVRCIPAGMIGHFMGDWGPVRSCALNLVQIFGNAAAHDGCATGSLNRYGIMAPVFPFEVGGLGFMYSHRWSRPCKETFRPLL